MEAVCSSTMVKEAYGVIKVKESHYGPEQIQTVPGD